MITLPLLLYEWVTIRQDRYHSLSEFPSKLILYKLPNRSCMWTHWANIPERIHIFYLKPVQKNLLYSYVYIHICRCVSISALTLKTIHLLLPLSTSIPYQVGAPACNERCVYCHMQCHALYDDLSFKSCLVLGETHDSHEKLMTVTMPLKSVPEGTQKNHHGTTVHVNIELRVQARTHWNMKRNLSFPRIALAFKE